MSPSVWSGPHCPGCSPRGSRNPGARRMLCRHRRMRRASLRRARIHRAAASRKPVGMATRCRTCLPPNAPSQWWERPPRSKGWNIGGRLRSGQRWQYGSSQARRLAGCQAHHELALEAVIGLERHLAQGTAPEQVRGHAAGRQRCAEMAVTDGVSAETRAIRRHQRSLPDIVLDGAEVGGAQLSFVLRPRPGRAHIPMRLAPLLVAVRAGSALGAADVFWRECAPLGPTPPFDLIAGPLEQKADARLPRIHWLAGIGVIAGHNAQAILVHQPGCGAGETLIVVVDNEPQAGGLLLDFDALKVAGLGVREHGVGRRVRPIEVPEVIARDVDGGERFDRASVARVGGVEVAFGPVKDSGKALALDDDLVAIVAPARRAGGKPGQGDGLLAAELDNSVVNHSTRSAGYVERDAVALGGSGWHRDFEFALSGGRKGEGGAPFVAIGLPRKLKLTEVGEGVAVLNWNANGLLP